MIETLPYEVKLKSTNYKVRVLEAVRGKSKKDNPMITLTTEIIDAPPQVVDGVEYDVNGIKVTSWATMTDNARKNFNTTMKALGLPEANQDFSNVEAENFIGQEASCYISCKSTNKLDDDGQIVKNPNTGEVQKIHQKNIEIWYPRSS